MMELIRTPVFGILISIVTYEVGLLIQRKTNLSILNPLLISIGIIISILINLNIPVKIFNIGGSIISFFLIPATVILAVPLYKQFHVLKSNVIPILGGIFVGALTAIVSITLFAKLFNLSGKIGLSLIPKSITTPIGIELSKQIGGIPSVTVTAIIITGITGAVIGPYICKLFGIKDEVAVGVSMGTASHAVGTSKAIELGETQGAMSSLSIGIAGLVTVLIAPIILNLLAM